MAATFALSVHRDYACRRTGACCTSGWAIPVEQGSRCARPVRRFLASHAFASWVGYQGGGVRTAVGSLRAALAVLETECVRACCTAGRPLVDDLLVDAIRASDLWLVHLAAPDALATRLSRRENLRLPGV